MEILNTLCHRGSTWKTNVKGELVNFKASYLKNDSMSWFLLVASGTIPFGHNSVLIKDRAALVYCILLKRRWILAKDHSSFDHSRCYWKVDDRIASLFSYHILIMSVDRG